MSTVPAHLDFLSPEDVLAAIHHTEVPVTIQGVSFKVRAPTITEICELLGRHRDLLELLDPSRKDEEDADNKDALIYLFRRAPHAVAALSACAMDRPGNSQFEQALLTKPDDFRLGLWFAAVEALLREHGTLQSFFTMVMARLQELGLTRVSDLLLPILAWMLSTLAPPEEAPSQSAKPKKAGGRKAA